MIYSVACRYRLYPSNLVLCILALAVLEGFSFVWPFFRKGGHSTFVSINLTHPVGERVTISSIQRGIAAVYTLVIEGVCFVCI